MSEIFLPSIEVYFLSQNYGRELGFGVGGGKREKVVSFKRSNAMICGKDEKKGKVKKMKWPFHRKNSLPSPSPIPILKNKTRRG